jgi:CspA family cold shock protein
METGVVKWYSESRGRGIIVSDLGKRQVNVSPSGIASPGFKILYEGQRVRFEIVQTAKGPAAVKVIAEEAADGA